MIICKLIGVKHTAISISLAMKNNGNDSDNAVSTGYAASTTTSTQ